MHHNHINCQLFIKVSTQYHLLNIVHYNGDGNQFWKERKMEGDGLSCELPSNEILVITTRLDHKSHSTIII